MVSLGNLKATEETHKKINVNPNLVTQIHMCEPLQVLGYAHMCVSFNKTEIILHILGCLCFLVKSYHLYYNF